MGKIGRHVLALALLFAWPADAHSVKSGHLQAELLVDSPSVTAGGDVAVGIRLVPDPGWHTYWVNPGETGLATEVSFTLPDGMTAGGLNWPAPQRLVYDNVVTYGYDRSATLIATLHNTATAKPSTILPIRAHVEALVCHDTCEPVTFDLKARLTVGAAPSPAHALSEALAAIPASLDLPARLTQKDGMVSIGLPTPGNAAARAAFAHSQGAYLFSENDAVISSSGTQAISAGPNGFSILAKGVGQALPPGPQAFVLRLADGQAWRLIATPGALPASTYDVGAPVKAPADATGIWLAVVLAFAGGLILNLMPCVFPVLSMKLLALTRAGHDAALARREALIYGLGAIVSFDGLSLAINLAHGLGTSLGWGFQLQSPIVTACLSALMLLVGLNMSGFFEVGAGLQARAGEQNLGHNPYIAAFLTGVLAVVVAAPCSAPFMATAMGVALAQGGMVSVAIFTALGFGFAAPFVVLTFAITLVPGVARLVPRPGAWMDRLRHILAIPMYLAALWMLWVFAQQTGLLAVAMLVAGLSLAGLCIATTVLHPPAKWVGWAVAIALCLFATLQTPSVAQHRGPLFSPQEIAVLRAQNRPVLVDLTAAWCITCKVNERVVLSSRPVQDALRATHTVYLVGDWTQRDSAISDYIHQFGRSGVPLYVYYGAGSQAPVVLPQLLTPDRVVKILRAQP